MMSDTEFFGRPYFTSDTGGTAVVKKDAKEVEVVFDREYIEAPILSASMAYSTSTDEAEIDAMFSDDVRFVVTKRDTKGFTIRLNKPASRDIVFNWIALAIKDSKEFTSKTIVPNSSSVTATTTPSVNGSDGTTTPFVVGTTTPIIINATTTPATGNGGGVGTTTGVVDTNVSSTTTVTDTTSTNLPAEAPATDPTPTVTPEPVVVVPPPVETVTTPVTDTTSTNLPAEAPATDPTPTVTP
jgi:hypothetical protein